jgi:DNA-binding PadR family transcriptional regulator
MARINKTQYAILGALSVYPMSGYDIKKWVTDVTGTFWSESPGQVHPTLENLVKNSLVICDDSQSIGDRPKKVYTITKKGITALKSWLSEPAEPTVSRDEFILKLFYGQHLSEENYLAHLQRQKKRMEEDLIRYAMIERHIKKQHKKNVNTNYWLITLSNAVHHANTEIAWCVHTINKIKRK